MRTSKWTLDGMQYLPNRNSLIAEVERLHSAARAEKFGTPKRTVLTEARRALEDVLCAK